MNCAIIGSTKIAEVHINELIKNNIKEIFIISRHKNKRIKIVKKFKKKFKNIKICEDKIDILKKKKFHIIDICSADEFHHIHLDLISNLKSIIIVEKPIISLLKYKKNYVNFLDKIYKKNKRIIVCYPMYFLCKEFLPYLDDKNKKIRFKFSTGGRYNYKKIGINLIPHALTFLTKLLKINQNTKIDIYKSEFRKNDCIFKLKIRKTNVEIFLSENLGQKTILSITGDYNKITRLTKIEKSKFINLLKMKNEIFTIKNPMSEFFKNFFNNINNDKYYYKNKNLTYLIMQINFQLMFPKNNL